MLSTHIPAPQEACTRILEEEIRKNKEQEISPSESIIADRLLARSMEMTDAYQELYNKLHVYPMALKVFLGAILSTSAYWYPEKMMQSRAARDELFKVNRQIKKAATNLAHLFSQRSELHNTSGFSSETHYHICDVIVAASSNNNLFQWNVQEQFEDLHCQYDMKYWPSLSEVLQEIATDANNAQIYATDPLTKAGTDGQRPSRADFCKALFVLIKENRMEHGGFLPDAFTPTDKTLATLVNCALNLAPDEMVDESYIKGIRQRERRLAW